MTRILVLEDDPDLREELCERLEQEGYEVAAAARGTDAVEFASRAPFDLIVTDVRMEGMDGLEALERMRAHQPDVPSMVITGYSSEEEAIRAARLGVGEFLKKPFSRQAFMDRVDALLNRRRAALSRQQNSHSVQRVALWALEALAGALDEREGSGLGPRLRALRLAASLAISMGLDEGLAVNVQMASVVASIRRRDDPDSVRGWDTHAMLASALTGLEEHWDGSGAEGLAGAAIPLESRVVAVAVEAADHPVAVDASPHASTAARLQAEFPGRFDPMVLEALATLAPEARGQETSSRIRGLISLGDMLEARGDAESARRAYAQVLRDAPDSRDALDAHQRRVALSVGEGRVEQATSEAHDALASARRLGPVAAAQVGLEVGLLLLTLSAHEAAGMLEEALRLADDLRLATVAARARLALARLRGQTQDRAVDEAESALDVLLQPENLDDLVRSAPWLLPLELEGGWSPLHGRAGRLLARECPTQVRRSLERGELSESARCAAARALSMVGGAAARDVLQVLAGDSQPRVRQAAAEGLQTTASGEEEAPWLRVSCLGGLQVFCGEKRVDDEAWKTQKVKFLFAWLVAAERPIPEEVLIEAFWPGDAEKGKRSLWAATTAIRKALERPGGVMRVGTGLQVDPALKRWHDADELERAMAHGRRLDEEGRRLEACDRFRRVAALYRGPYLDGCYMDWALQIRERLEQYAQEALLRLCRGALDLGQPREALEHGARLLELDPCHQEAHLCVMQACMAGGRPEEAVRQYERCVRVLKKELGMEPAIALVEAWQRARLSMP